jgi:hypothetical protein
MRRSAAPRVSPVKDVGQEGQVAPVPGSVLVVREEEWLVQRAERSADGAWFADVQGVFEVTRNTNAAFSAALVDIEVLDPAAVRVVPCAPATGGQRSSWRRCTARRPSAVTDQTLTVTARGLAELLPNRLGAS